MVTDTVALGGLTLWIGPRLRGRHEARFCGRLAHAGAGFQQQGERTLGHPVHDRPCRAVVRGHDHAEALCRQHHQLAAEVEGRARMVGHRATALDAVVAEGAQQPAQAHPQVGVQRHIGVLHPQHLGPLGLRQHHHAARIAAFGKLHRHETRELAHAGHEAAGRQVTQGRLPLQFAAPIRAGHGGPGGHLGAEQRFAHAQRREQCGLQPGLEGLATGRFDHRTHHIQADVGIRKSEPRGRVGRHLGQAAQHAAKVALGAGGAHQPHAAGDVARQAGVVRHQLAQRDRGRARGAAEAEPGQGLLHRGVEREPTVGDQLHRRGVGEELGDRAHAVQRVRIGGTPLGQVGPAMAPGRDHLLVVDQRDAQPGDPGGRDLGVDGGLQLAAHGREIAPCDRYGRRGCRGAGAEQGGHEGDQAAAAAGK